MDRVRPSLEDYPAPLSDAGRREMPRLERLLEDRLQVWRSTPGPEERITDPPREWFEPYFTRFSKEQAMRSALDIAGKGLVNVYVTEGCSRQCHYCFRDTPPEVRSMPWCWVTEILDAFIERRDEYHQAALNLFPERRAGHLPMVFGWADNDPLRDYHDPLYDRDYADICELLLKKTGECSFFISTSGWEMGSTGERAARKLATLARQPGVRIRLQLHINTESEWFEALGREAYIRHMRSVFGLAREIVGPEWKDHDLIGVGYGRTEAQRDPDLAREIFQDDFSGDLVTEYTPTRAEGRASRYPGLNDSPDGLGYPENLRFTIERELILVRESVEDGLLRLRKSRLLP